MPVEALTQSLYDDTREKEGRVQILDVHVEFRGHIHEPSETEILSFVLFRDKSLLFDEQQAIVKKQ